MAEMSERKAVAVGLGALVPAFGVTGTWFCRLPLAAGGLGVGAAALGTSLVPLRPYLFGASVLLLGVAFYNAYRPRAECGQSGSCPRARTDSGSARCSGPLRP